MIIKSARRSAVAAVCLTAIVTLSSAHAQMGGSTAPGSYWPPPGAYGPPSGPYAAPGPYWSPPAPYAAPGPYWSPPAPYGPPPRAYGPAPGSYAPQSQYVPPRAGPQVITNGPQTSPGDVSPSWSPQRNVAESEHYDRLLKENPAFRQARIRKECGPITDPQLHQQCLDSFARY